MIKLKPLLLEHDEDESQIDLDRIYWNTSYRADVLEKFGYNYDFNKLFWEYPRPLYHCTQEEYLPLIQTKGLTRQSKTRGINNRSVGAAIFTTQEGDEVESLRQSYGPVVIVINTEEMKKDGFMPVVQHEPEVEEAMELAFIFHKLGQEDVELSRFIDSSGGISEYTVIIHDNIPPKYLKVLGA